MIKEYQFENCTAGQLERPFKKGDRVVAINRVGDFGEFVEVGTEGIIDHITGNVIHVIFPGHDCWGLSPQDIKRVDNG